MSTETPDGVTVRVHRLTMVAEDDGVMVGRPRPAPTRCFPGGGRAPEAARCGTPLAAAVDWYERETGSGLDVDDFVETLEELGFLRGADEEPHRPDRSVAAARTGRLLPYGPRPLRRDDRAALVAMVRDPVLRPSYRNMFFTGHLSFIPIVLTRSGSGSSWCTSGATCWRPAARAAVQAGDRPRLYYLVAETRLDSLLSVPRRRRYLPFLAGLLSDAVVIAAATLLAAWLRALDAPVWTSGLALAVAFITVLRVVWQFQLYLRTDLYYVAATMLRCTDLQAATKSLIAALYRRALRRPARPVEEDWSDRDRTAAAGTRRS